MQCTKCSKEIPDETKFCPHCGNPITGSVEFNAVSDALSEKYALVREIGRGGMAIVYEAVDRKLDRKVAIKVLSLHLTGDENLRARFLQEARRAANLKHPGIVTIYEADQKGEVSYIAMELLEGTDLEKLIHDRGVIPLPEAIQILKQISEALTYAHGQGLVHRDVKPSNIFFANDGRVLLMDFGICKAADGSNLTQTGTSMGTPEYMSPEQVEGKPDIDGRSDIYALGIVFFQMITGQCPYSATTPMAVAMKQINEPIPSAHSTNPNLPQGVDMMIAKAMQKDRNNRYQTAQEMAADFERLFSAPATPAVAVTPTTVTPTPGVGTTLPSQPTPPPQPQMVPPPQQTDVKKRQLIIGGVIAILVIIIGILLGYLASDGSGNISERETRDFVEQWKNSWITSVETSNIQHYQNLYDPAELRVPYKKNKDYYAYMEERRKIASRTHLLFLDISNMQFENEDGRKRVTFTQDYLSDRYGDTGIKTLVLVRKSDEIKIVLEDFDENKIAKMITHRQLAALLEKWQRAWESVCYLKSITNLQKFYASDFYSYSDGRDYRAHMNRRKNGYKASKMKIIVKSMQMGALRNKAVASFDQEYLSDRYSDIGRKIMVFELRNGQWSITREDFKRYKKLPKL